jgi:hypothetical protein
MQIRRLRSLGMTKSSGLLKGEDRCRCTGRLLRRRDLDNPPLPSTTALLIEINKVTATKETVDDK